MFSGYLVRIHGTTDYDIPLGYIAEKSYKCTYSTLDLEPFRDANGILHRNAVLKTPKVTLVTRSLKNTEVADLFNNIASRYVNAMEKKVLITAYLPETDNYLTGYFYVPDTEFNIHTIQGNIIKYDAITLSFIGYGD